VLVILDMVVGAFQTMPGVVDSLQITPVVVQVDRDSAIVPDVIINTNEASSESI
jgi:hypothetical protein